MTLLHSAKVLLGKALRPLHAGEQKLMLQQPEVHPARDMILHADAFELDAPIPRRHAGPGEGDNVSPALRWSGVPPHTRELVLVCEDPDAPFPMPYLHWLVYRIPPEANGLPEGIAPVTAPPIIPGLVQAKNSAREIGYTGPLPPPGHGPHRYYFQLFALDTMLALSEAPDRAELLAAMTGHVLGEGVLVGVYERT